ncbi:hypothetical protein VCHA53O466_140060 [Vibrio chagasii]|nr:hypothetical protein VCHA53O466_140060 [Vibrio chagasii]
MELKVNQASNEMKPNGRGFSRGLSIHVTNCLEVIATDTVFESEINGEKVYWKVNGVRCASVRNREGHGSHVSSDYSLAPYSFRFDATEVLCQELIGKRLTLVEDKELLEKLKRESTYC